jgi:predicted nucleic-acid-binding protein
MKELCFESELKNGNLISSIVEINEKIVIPKYYFANKNLIVMEKLKGVKINRSEYLSNQTKKNIANSTSIFFIKLIFKERIIWPDPHPGNLLFIEEKNSIGIIDLNPIYQWEARDIHHFILLIMNLLIKDTDKVIFYLKKLKNSNHEGINKIIISQHFNRFKDKAPKDFILSFFKLLINEGISLKTEVTLVVKSILQLSFSLNSFSNDFDFYTILKYVLIKDHRHYFLRHIGFSKVFYYILSYSLKTLIEKNKLDFGPLMDEGDLNCFNDIFKNLEERNICEIKINRISPDGSLLFYPSLKDGNSKISAILRIHPTSNTLLYQYEILIPEKQWLKENNSYLYFISFCYFISMIEFLEKMKRFSSEQYLLVMSSLIKSEKFLTPHDKKIIIETKIQATKTLLKKVKLLFRKSHLILKCVLFFQLKSLHFERTILKREPSIFLSFLKFQHLILNFFIYFFKKYYNGYFPQDLFIPVNSKELIKSSLGILNREN